MGRKRKETQTVQDVKEKASEVREQAKALAGTGGEAVRDFADTTGAAAKRFAETAFDAAKELLETVERAGERLNEDAKPAKRKGRRFLKATIALGAGAALFANDKVRNTVLGVFGGGSDDDPWTVPSGNGDRTPATTTTT